MHNVLRTCHLGDPRTSYGENIWEKRESLVAEAKAAQENQNPYNALGVDGWSQLIRPRDTRNVCLLSNHS
jgi:hypothetical protein